MNLCWAGGIDRLDEFAVKGSLWCLHGAVGRAAAWEGFALPDWMVRRVDLWRFLACCPMSLPEFGAALNEEAWGVQRSGAEGARVLVAYSMGGRLALHALLAKGPWDAAILIAPHPGLEREEERMARRASDARWAGLAMSGNWREFLSEWGAQPLLVGAAAGEPPSETSRREIARSFVDWSLGAQEPLWQRLPEIACPVLWCVGERDGKFRELGERAVGLLPNAELWVVAGAGHRVPWEQPEAFRAKVGEFLERVLS